MKLPTLKPVESSNIAEIAHHGDALFVKFKGGNAVYEYQGVPPHVHEAMLKAPSVGSYFAQNVKGRFSHRVHAL